MRTAQEQIEINAYNLAAQVKKLKTSINYFEDMLKKKDVFDPRIIQNLEDDAITVTLGADKLLLLQLMRDSDSPVWPDDT